MCRRPERPPAPVSGPHKHLLLLDDNAMNLDYLTKVVTKAGYEPVAAASAGQALQILSTRPIALVITDLAMPGVHGFDVITHLRQVASLAHLPVIICSAMKTPEDVKKAAALQVHSFIVKPIDRAHLLARITAALQEQVVVPSLL